MARRRALGGRPLLVAAGGLAMTVACSGHSGPDPEKYPPPGNLMPPPTITGELCVDTVPTTASVTVNGNPVTARCSPVSGYEGQAVEVVATALGYEFASQSVALAPTMNVTLTLGPAEAPPVGNLVAPPMPPPGNLMPPPKP